MAKILLLGAGLVAKPLIDYFLDNNYFLTVADIDSQKALNLIENNPNGMAVTLNITKDQNKLNDLIKDHDIVVTLLPPNFTPLVAKFCISNTKNLVSTNYVAPETRELSMEAEKAGITIIGESGVDPGLDHMIAKKIIDEAHNKNAEVLSFKSYCGGLPAPESNNNPFGYKFSWSPRGVLLASKRNAIYKEKNKTITIPEGKIFSKQFISELPVDKVIGSLEVYANSDSVKYKDIYNIPEAESIFRSTLRYSGWSETIYALQKIKYLQLEEYDCNCSYSDYLAKLINNPNQNIKQEVADFLQLPIESKIIEKFEWLGLFSNEKIKNESAKISPLDLLTSIMLSKMTYSEDEKDVLVLINEFIIKHIDGSTESIKASLIEYGTSRKYSAMAKTVSYPAALCTELLLKGKINQKGVIIPTHKEIYEPVLEKISELGINIVIDRKK